MWTHEIRDKCPGTETLTPYFGSWLPLPPASCPTSGHAAKKAWVLPVLAPAKPQARPHGDHKKSPGQSLSPFHVGLESLGHVGNKPLRPFRAHGSTSVDLRTKLGWAPLCLSVRSQPAPPDAGPRASTASPSPGPPRGRGGKPRTDPASSPFCGERSLLSVLSCHLVLLCWSGRTPKGDRSAGRALLGDGIVSNLLEQT